MECAFSIKLFKSILSENIKEYAHLSINLLSLLNVDKLSIVNILNDQINADVTDFNK